MTPMSIWTTGDACCTAENCSPGEATEHSGTALISLDEYVDGVVHSLCREWCEDGTLRGKGRAQRGRAVGATREWHPNGVLAAEQVFTEGRGELLAQRAWDDRGHMVRDRQKNSE